MNIDLALEQLGAADFLSTEELSRLDEQGYLLFEALLSPGEVAAVNRRLDELEATEQDFIDFEGCIRMHELHTFGEMFDRLWLDPRLLAGTAHLMRDEFKLYQLGLRTIRPGAPRQSLHVDAEPRSDRSGRAALVNSAWMLDDFTMDNGPTRLIPGSHRWPGTPSDLNDPAKSHPLEIDIVAPAGSLLVFSGHVWHGGGKNQTAASRRGIFTSYHERHIVPPPSHQALYEHHRPKIGAVATQTRLSEAANYLLAGN